MLHRNLSFDKLLTFPTLFHAGCLCYKADSGYQVCVLRHLAMRSRTARLTGKVNAR